MPITAGPEQSHAYYCANTGAKQGRAGNECPHSHAGTARMRENTYFLDSNYTWQYN